MSSKDVSINIKADGAKRPSVFGKLYNQSPFVLLLIVLLFQNR